MIGKIFFSYCQIPLFTGIPNISFFFHKTHFEARCGALKIPRVYYNDYSIIDLYQV